jgi:5-keto 4-deoxyuronate isomerase
MTVQMDYRESTDRAGMSRMTVRELRNTFVIDKLFQPGELGLSYLEIERAVVGSATPTACGPDCCRPTRSWPRDSSVSVARWG